MKTLVPYVAIILFLASSSVALGCETGGLCEEPNITRYPIMGGQIGITIHRDWVEKNIESIHESFLPGCEAFGKCLSVWGNPAAFCRLQFTADLRSECEKRFDAESDLEGWKQCRAVADIFSKYQAQAADRAWPAIQKCAAEKAGDGPIESPRVELVPPVAHPRDSLEFVVKAFDRETGVPVWGLVTVDGRNVGPTFQAFSYNFGFVRTSDKYGRISLSLPVITVRTGPAPGSNFPGYPETTVPVTMPVPKVVLTFDPSPENWTPGKNVVRVMARDAETGKAIVGDIRAPGVVVGDAAQPVTITLKGTTEPCSDPIWFRARRLDYPDETFPVSPCR